MHFAFVHRCLRSVLTVTTLVLGLSAWPLAPAAAQGLPRGAATHSLVASGPAAKAWQGTSGRRLSLSQLPSDLASVMRRTLARQAVEDYDLFHLNGRYRTANPAQQFETVFGPAGPVVSGVGPRRRWTWGMRVTGLGRERMSRLPHASMAAQGNRLVFRHGSLVEWYRNSSRGLEQGFTLQQRPSGPSTLPIRLMFLLSGDLRAQLGLHGAGLAFVTAAGVPVLRYTGLAVRDARGRPLPAHLALHGTSVWLVVDDAGAQYPVTIDPWLQTQLDLGGSAAFNDSLGASVALSGDGSMALLGAYGRTVQGQNDAGVGEIFVRSNGIWRFSAQLDLGANAAAGDDLGRSAALSADGNTVLLGSNSRTIYGHSYAGAGEVFVRSNGTWSGPTELSLGAGATASDALGDSVALSSDGNTALLGADQRTVDGKATAGTGEVFVRSGGSWSGATELSLGANANSGDELGYAVALSGDGGTALVGARYRAVNGVGGAGAGEVFVRSNGSWGLSGQLSLGPAAAADNYLGASVALSEDGSVALLGTPFRQVSGKSNAGAGEVYARSNGTWSYVTQLDLGANAATDDNAGVSVALSGDGDTALLGVYSRNVQGQNDAGAGEVFAHGSGGWSVATQIDLSSVAAASDMAGISVTLSGDGNTALVGDWGRTVNGQANAGAGEVFVRRHGIWSFAAQLDLGVNAAAGDAVGDSAALSGDGGIALLGAIGRSVSGHSGAGAGEVFVWTNGGWSFMTQLDLGANAAAKDQLGGSAALSVDGTTALLGATGRTVNSFTQSGAGELFMMTDGVWSYATQLDLGTKAYGDRLGTSVALSADGNTALLGAPSRTVYGFSSAGAGEAFVRIADTWYGPTELSLSANAATQDELGKSVALSADGNTALLGAYGRTVSTASAAGAGEIFVRSYGSWTGPTELSLGPKASANDNLGNSAALSGDGAVALLGAPGRTVNGQSNAGAGEVFVQSGSGWSGPTELGLGANAMKFDSVGWSAALDGDGHTALLGAVFRTVSGKSFAGAGEVFADTTAPNAPSTLQAVAGNNVITLQWAPSSDTLSPITGYTIIPHSAGCTASPATATCPVMPVNLQASPLVCPDDGGPVTCTTTISGLTYGASYTFTMTATNSVGTSLESVAFNALTFAEAPGPPSNVQATAGNQSATITWQPPTTNTNGAPPNGGSPILYYTVTCSPACIGGSSAAQISAQGPSSKNAGQTLSTTITGLTNGTGYTFTVTAVNAVGSTGVTSNAVNPGATVLGPVTNLMVTATNNAISATWSAPSDDGGAAITSYTVTVDDGDALDKETKTFTTLPNLPVSFPELVPDTMYAVTVVATNSVGAGGSAAKTVETGLPAVPLVSGWNLVAIPLMPNPAIADSAALIGNITTHYVGAIPSIRAIATYSNGRFSLAVPAYSAPLALHPGQGIFVLSGAATNWTPPGALYTSPSGGTPEPTITLQHGWNLVGASYPTRGLEGTAIDGELGNTSTQCGLQEIATYSGSGYAVFLHNATTSFHVPLTSGMWIECTRTYAWTPS